MAHIIDDEKHDESEIKSSASSNGVPKSSATRKQSLRYTKNIIQDYHFKHNVLASLSFIMLGVLSASTVSLINIPFQVLFVIQASLSGYNWNDTLKFYQSRIHGPLLILILVVQLIWQYAHYIYSFS